MITELSAALWKWSLRQMIGSQMAKYTGRADPGADGFATMCFGLVSRGEIRWNEQVEDEFASIHIHSARLLANWIVY